MDRIEELENLLERYKTFNDTKKNLLFPDYPVINYHRSPAKMHFLNDGKSWPASIGEHLVRFLSEPPHFHSVPAHSLIAFQHSEKSVRKKCLLYKVKITS